MKNLTIRLTLAAVAWVACLPAVALGAGYTNIYNNSYFSWLDQYSLTNGNIGSQACVPTSAVNALTFLQNTAPGYFGTNLTGTNYESWLNTGYTLAGPSYLNTTTNGTMLYRLPYALNSYVVTNKGFSNVTFSGQFATNNGWESPYDRPSNVAAVNPTTAFLTNALSMQSAIMFSVEYFGTNAGHEMTLTGLKWNDANDNGIIEFEENARLFFVDPLDSSTNYSPEVPTGPAKFSEGQIWYDTSSSSLRLTYDQYAGALPYTNSYSASTNSFIDAFYTVTVPEPPTVGLLLLSSLGLAGWMIRRGRGRR